ncbi:MAG TPA: CBS domain-containing protein [Candidatus Thermoplasmatota archaeon]|nr:CBS domain-containing protein [Candidatus Thermoplasmatota archaeon]
MADISSFLRTDFKAVDKRDPLHSVKGWLTGDASKVPIVVDDGRPFGILNERALMGRHLDLHAHVHQFALATRALTPDSTPEQARARMAELRAAYLPVEDKRGKLLGYVRAIDLARDELVGERARALAVPVTLLREDQTMGEALNAFAKEYVEFLPVVGRDGRIGGVLSRAKVLEMEFNNGDKGRRDAGGEKFHMLDDPIAGFMDQAPSFVAPEADTKTLLDTLEDAGYAIVERDQGDPAVGLVTPETLFRAGGR